MDAAVAHTPVTSAPGPATSELDAVLRDYLQATERLQHTHQSLQAEVARLRAELATKDRELELRSRLAALGELAAGVAHEVRNPLGAIQLYSDLLRKEYTRGEHHQGLQLLEKIEAGIRAIDGIVQDTLALAPARAQAESCALRDILRHVIDTVQPVLRRRVVSLHMDEPAGAIWLTANAEGLQRVLVNLVTNAAEASPAGGEIAVRVDAPRDDDEQLVIRVQDRGCGLPEEVLHRIFDPFFTTKDHGTGLGLTIAHRLVESYGGRLTARNRAGGGAEFRLTLRRAAPHAAPATPDRGHSGAACA